ncbi:DUF4811 domain-containing protein [Lactobacillus sp. ESL0785]|uniref:DUF4811 domain-containing protein n=1 Tax=Lactobacillus sp. ESL0785 TaxID=2983232 RepID=UPI0023F6DD7D|nr:DUF4811 domain-containing protein [Lactobacillus sp. ESL0785]WEV70888.1 DUF4811 domain-containing protein [Lactobacillus sp. ESL0785]
MILVTLIVSVLALFIFFVYTNKPAIRYIGTALSVIVFGLSLIFMTLNSYSHFGMHQATHTEVTQIYPASSKNGLNLMLYKEIGTDGKETVQVYKKTLNQKKPSHTQANEYTVKNNRLKFHDGDNGILKTTETRWQFNSKMTKFWFGWSELNGKLVKRTNTFYLPKSWLHLSTDQVKKLQQKMGKMKTPAAKAKTKEQAKKFVQQKLAQAMKTDHSLATNKTKQARLAKQYGQKFQRQLIQKLVH